MVAGSVVDRDMGKVELTALRDQRLTRVEDAAREWARAMIEADDKRGLLVEALENADALNGMAAGTVTDQMLADWVNHGVPDGAEAFGQPLASSLMKVRRMLGKATDNRRARTRRNN